MYIEKFHGRENTFSVIKFGDAKHLNYLDLKKNLLLCYIKFKFSWLVIIMLM